MYAALLFQTSGKRVADQNQHIYFLDAATRFHGYPSAQVFLDDCHLSDYGHELLAKWLSEDISNGVLNASNP